MVLQLLWSSATVSGLINILLSYFKHHVSMRITTWFLTGLLEKLSIADDNEIPESLRSFCHKKLIYSQMFTGNPHFIRWASRFAAGFAWLLLCFESSLWLEIWYFYFTDSKLDRRVTQLILTLSLGAEGLTIIWDLTTISGLLQPDNTFEVTLHTEASKQF